MVSATVSAKSNSDFFALVVSAENSYMSSEQDLNYAGMDADRVATALTTASGVPKENILQLKNPTIADLQRAVKKLALRSSKKFLFYFSGHSDEFGLNLRDGKVNRKKFHQLLGAVSSKVKIVVLDSCFSGALKSKGVRSSKPIGAVRFDVDEPTGSVILTSSSAQEMSYESEKLKGSIFTNHLITGLYGEADGNEDGLVTIDELYQYVYGQSKYQSMVSGNVSQSPEFKSQLTGQGAVVVSFPSTINGEVLLASNLQGELTFASDKGMNFFKFYKTRGKPQRIEVPKGTYNVTLLDSDRIGKTQLEIAAKEKKEIQSVNMIWKDRVKDRLTAKGKKSEFLFGVAVMNHSGYGEGQKGGTATEFRLLSPGTEAANGLWRLSLHAGGSAHRDDNPNIEETNYQRFTIGGEGTYGSWKALNNNWIFGLRVGTVTEEIKGAGSKTYGLTHLSFGSRHYFQTTPIKIDFLIGIETANRDGQEGGASTFGIAISY